MDIEMLAIRITVGILIGGACMTPYILYWLLKWLNTEGLNGLNNEVTIKQQIVIKILFSVGFIIGCFVGW